MKAEYQIESKELNLSVRVVAKNATKALESFVHSAGIEELPSDVEIKRLCILMSR